MAKFSTGLRTGMLQGTGFVEALNGGYLRIFSGPAPATADDPETGELLMELTAGGDGDTGLSFGAAQDGAISKSDGEVWMTDSISASGTVSHFRFVSSDDTGELSTTEPRIQGGAGLVGADMTLTNMDVTAGNPWTLNFFTVGLPTRAE